MCTTKTPDWNYLKLGTVVGLVGLVLATSRCLLILRLKGYGLWVGVEVGVSMGLALGLGFGLGLTAGMCGKRNDNHVCSNATECTIIVISVTNRSLTRSLH